MGVGVYVHVCVYVFVCMYCIQCKMISGVHHIPTIFACLFTSQVIYIHIL